MSKNPKRLEEQVIFFKNTSGVILEVSASGTTVFGDMIDGETHLFGPNRVGRITGFAKIGCIEIERAGTINWFPPGFQKTPEVE